MNTEIQNNIQQNMLKSNTSLVGIKVKDAVVMGADRRGTAGTIVMSKNHVKIRNVNPYIAAAYTGGVADLQLAHKILAAELRLKELRTKSRATTEEAANLLASITYRNIRTPAMIPNIVGTIIGGVDEDGSSHLFSIEPAGGVDEVKEYDANFSSGMPYILGLLERQYRKDMTIKEAVELAKECIKASTQRDVGSGNGIDVFLITKDGIKHVVSEEIVAEYRPE